MTDAEWAHVLNVTIPGEPVPKGRPRFVNGRVVTPKRTRDAETRVKQYVAVAMLGRWHEPEDMARAFALGRYRLDLLFVYGNRRRGDLDNADKLVQDALNKVVYDDDSQVDELHVTRAVDREHPRTELTVWRRVAVVAPA